MTVADLDGGRHHRDRRLPLSWTRGRLPRLAELGYSCWTYARTDGGLMAYSIVIVALDERTCSTSASRVHCQRSATAGAALEWMAQQARDHGALSMFLEVRTDESCRRSVSTRAMVSSASACGVATIRQSSVARTRSSCASPCETSYDPRSAPRGDLAGHGTRAGVAAARDCRGGAGRWRAGCPGVRAATPSRCNRVGGLADPARARCHLRHLRTVQDAHARPCSASASEQAHWMIVGEAPGAEEERARRALRGPGWPAARRACWRASA